MQVFCKGANLRAAFDLLTTESSSYTNLLQDVKSTFGSTFHMEKGSAMFQDILLHDEDCFFYPHKSDLTENKKAKLDGTTAKLLYQLLDKQYYLSKSGITQLPSVLGWSLSKAQHRGIWYRKAADDTRHGSHKDSHICKSKR